MYEEKLEEALRLVETNRKAKRNTVDDIFYADNWENTWRLKLGWRWGSEPLDADFSSHYDELNKKDGAVTELAMFIKLLQSDLLLTSYVVYAMDIWHQFSQRKHVYTFIKEGIGRIYSPFTYTGESIRPNAKLVEIIDAIHTYCIDRIGYSLTKESQERNFFDRVGLDGKTLVYGEGYLKKILL